MRLIRLLSIACLLLAAESGIATASDLLVSSRFSDNVLRYDGETGAFRGVFASGNGLDNPNGIAFGPDGALYAGNGDEGRVLAFDGRTGAYLRDFVTPAASGGLLGCRDIAFLPDGDLIVANGAGNNVLRYERNTGRAKGVFASGFTGPVGLHVGSDSTVYVGAALSNAVSIFDGNGVLRRTIAPPAGRGESVGVAIDARGALLVVLSQSNVVRRLDFVGDTDFLVGGGLSTPIDVVLRPDGDLLVGSFLNDKVVRFDGDTGALVGDFITSGSGGLDGTHFFAFMPAPLVLDERFDGSWTIGDAARQGVFTDVSLQANTFFAAVFTFDPAGGESAQPAWLVFQGPLSGASSMFQVYRVASGTFLEPRAAALDTVGTGSVEVLDCNHMRLRLALNGRSEAIETIDRLLPRSDCGAP